MNFRLKPKQSHGNKLRFVKNVLFLVLPIIHGRSFGQIQSNEVLPDNSSHAQNALFEEPQLMLQILVSCVDSDDPLDLELSSSKAHGPAYYSKRTIYVHDGLMEVLAGERARMHCRMSLRTSWLIMSGTTCVRILPRRFLPRLIGRMSDPPRNRPLPIPKGSRRKLTPMRDFMDTLLDTGPWMWRRRRWTKFMRPMTFLIRFRVIQRWTNGRSWQPDRGGVQPSGEGV